jgi:putative membrane protein
MAALMAAMQRVLPPLKIKRKLLSYMGILALYGWFVIWAVNYEHLPHLEWGAESTVVNGLVLGFLISFRNNHAYDRWWEARKLWGQLINENRNLALKVQTLSGIEPADRQRIGTLLIAFASALKDHLRGGRGPVGNPTSAEPAPYQDHQPSRLAASIYETVTRWRREGRADGWTLLWLDGHMKSLMDICGACERIKNTPLSSSYRALLRHGIALYLLVAPFYLIEDIGPSAFPMFMIASYFLIGIEMVAAEIEEPFGVGGDNLPLERYCATVEASVREIMSSN